MSGRGGATGGRIRRLYVRVLAMQILTLLGLWLLQAAFGLGAG